MGHRRIYSWFFQFSFVVEEILARTEVMTLRKIYSLPEFSSTLEFLTMLALTSGRLLKVRDVDEHHIRAHM